MVYKVDTGDTRTAPPSANMSSSAFSPTVVDVHGPPEQSNRNNIYMLLMLKEKNRDGSPYNIF